MSAISTCAGASSWRKTSQGSNLLQPPLDRSFKKPGGYVVRDKLAAAREGAGQPKPKARPK
ncbi:MAG: hypothetical protein ACSLFN_00150 [Candidatus Limnocylindrales bacterium]